MYDPIFDTKEGKAVLKRVIAHYSDVFLPCEEKDRAYYRGLTTKDAARSAGLLRRHDKQRHSHAEDWVAKEDSERRAASLELLAKELVGRVGKLHKSMCFPEIHAVVEEAATAVRKARHPKPTPLLRYDAALMLAWRLKSEPEEVWLHSGTDRGVRTLGIGTAGRKTVTLAELPKPFRKLPAWQVEDILCIYRRVFLRLVTGRDADEALLTEIAQKRPAMGCKHRRCTTAC
ncbi:hypothetical protein [Streptomyces hydrogenans]